MTDLEMLDISVIQQGARFINILPEIENFLNSMEDALERKVYAALDKGELTPQAALNAWIEKRTMQQLYTKFAQRVKMAQTMGTQYQDTMNERT